MEEKRIIEVDEGRDTDFVDNTLLAAIDASTKRAKRREGRDER